MHKDDEDICFCFGVTRGTIVSAIKEHKLTTFEGVGEKVDAGTACGGCQDSIQLILDEVNGK